MNGGLIVGSRDGANLEIEKELGQQNVFLFGSDKNRLCAYQHFVSYIRPNANNTMIQLKERHEGLSHIDISLNKVFEYCRQLPDLRYLTEHFIAPLEQGIDP